MVKKSPEKDRFKVGDTIYISNWFHNQPSDMVITAKIVSRLDQDPLQLKWIKYEMMLDGGKRKDLIGDYGSPDVWGARIHKKSKKPVYKPRYL